MGFIFFGFSFVVFRSLQVSNDDKTKALLSNDGANHVILENGKFPPPLSIDLATASARAAADYLVGTIQSDGKFHYRVDITGQKARFAGRFNLLRQIATLRSLGEYYKGQSSNAKRTASLTRGFEFIVKTSVHPVKHFGRPILALFNDSSLKNSNKPKFNAELGGTALVLITSLNLETKVSQIQARSTLNRGLANFLLSMQKEDGSFYDLLVPNQGATSRTKIKSKHSQAPAQAVMAMILYYKKTADRTWLTAALKGLKYLLRERISQADLPLSMWPILAIESFQQIASGEIESLRPAIERLCIKLGEKGIKGQILDPQNPFFGAFLIYGNPRPNSSRLETLIAALKFLPPESTDLRKKVRRTIEFGLDQLYRSQVTLNEFKGAFPKEQGGYDVRIDYTEHGMNAMSRYAQLLRLEARTTTSGSEAR